MMTEYTEHLASVTSLDDEISNQHRLNILMKPIPYVDGRNANILNEFLEYLSFIFKQLRGSEQHRKDKIVDILLSKSIGELQGYIYQLISNLEHPNSYSWQDIKQKVLQRFSSIESSQIARIELSRAIQQPTESALHFLERIEKLGRSAYMDQYDSSDNQKRCLEIIVKGLSDEYLAKKIYKNIQSGTVSKLLQVHNIITSKNQEEKGFVFLRHPQSLSLGGSNFMENRVRTEQPMEVGSLFEDLRSGRTNGDLNSDSENKEQKVIEIEKKKSDMFSELNKKVENLKSEILDSQFKQLNESIEYLGGELRNREIKGVPEKKNEQFKKESSVNNTEKSQRKYENQNKRRFSNQSQRKQRNYHSYSSYNNENNNDNRRMDVKCYHCGRLGHIAKECYWSKGNYRGGNNFTSRSQNNSKGHPSEFKNYHRNMPQVQNFQSNPSVGFTTSAPSNSNSDNNKRTIVCHRCKELNHYANECRAHLN